jgi:organic hydroperoxide reductase OsmC/OhrA
LKVSIEDHRFRADVIWDGKSGGNVRIGGSRKIKLDMPIEFGGMGRYPCPDELFLSGIGAAYLRHFFTLGRDSVSVKGFEISVNGTIGAGPQGYRISGLDVTISAKTKKENEGDVRRCIMLAKEYCHIARTLEKVIPMEIKESVNATGK